MCAVCRPECGDRGCLSDGRTCCHAACLGGCSGPTESDCHVCAKFSFGYGAQRKCLEACPDKTYEVTQHHFIILQVQVL